MFVGDVVSEGQRGGSEDPRESVSVTFTRTSSKRYDTDTFCPNCNDTDIDTPEFMTWVFDYFCFRIKDVIKSKLIRHSY